VLPIVLTEGVKKLTFPQTTHYLKPFYYFSDSLLVSSQEAMQYTPSAEITVGHKEA